MGKKLTEVKFSLGERLCVTRGALAVVPAEERLLALLTKHALCNWGDVSEFDWRANDEAVTDGGRLLSVYRTTSGVTFWIITEADRSSTTILLPEEY